jgi:hypothetical protein
MTPGFCYKKAAAYKFFAVFNGTRCYGGNDLGPSLRKSKSSKECTIPCKGRNSKQTCGGSEAFQLYVNHAAPVVPPPTPEPKRAPAAKPLAASASRPKVSAGRTPVVFTEVVDQNLGQMVDAMELPADGEHSLCVTPLEGRSGVTSDQNHTSAGDASHRLTQKDLVLLVLHLRCAVP